MRFRSTHAQRLERWIGASQLAVITGQMRQWYGPPVPLANVPGRVFVTRDGEFVGPIRGGHFASLTDLLETRLRRGARLQTRTVGMGFSSLSDLISEATSGGKLQQFPVVKVGTVATNTSNESLWTSAGMPGIGATPATGVPGGEVPTSATAGALGFTNAAGGDTLHLTTITMVGNAAPNVLVIYDRIFQAKDVPHNTTGATSVTGQPGRWNQTNSNCAGNFAFLEVTNALGTTAHNIQLSYKDQSNNGAETAPNLAAVVSAVATRIPHMPFFVPLNGPDTGVQEVESITMTAVSSGTSNVVMGHIAAMVPLPVANQGVIIDGINSAFNLVRIYDSACLTMLELKGVATATTYTGLLTMVSG